MTRQRRASQPLQRGNARKAASKKLVSALDLALLYAKEGVRVIWIPSRSKAPIVKNWPNVATTDTAIIRQWAEKHTGCNFGLVMGNGFAAIDVDDPSVLPQLAARGINLSEVPTRLHETGGGGLHFLYRLPKTLKLKNTVKLFGLPVDIRHDGGQIVSPGSRHPNGAVYKIGDETPIAELPAKWFKLLTEPKVERTSARGKIKQGERNSVLASEAGKLHRSGVSASELEGKLQTINTENCDPPLSSDEVATIASSIARYPLPAHVEALLNDERPRVVLPTANRLVSDVAAELGEHLRGVVFSHARETVAVSGATMRPVSAQEFRTLPEDFVICCRTHSTGRGVSTEVDVTMGVEDARAILASPQFHAKLLPLKSIATCRMPVLRADDSIELPGQGYDRETEVMTVCDVEYDEEMEFEEAVAVITDLFTEFEFVDQRSRAILVAALLGLYAAHLVPAGALRPVFIVTKNGEGAGATTAVACAVVPVLGNLPTGAKPDDDAEMSKMLTSALREGKLVVLLDNVKSTIGGASLEALTSATTWSARLLGLNETVTVENTLTVFATGNGCTITPDMRRRSLVAELHLSAERAEDRHFERPLNVATLRTMRPKILGACFALVKHWDMQGRPKPTRSHSAFPEWAAVIGGIVESAGFGCPFETPTSSIAADEDGADMRALATSMKIDKRYTAQELYGLCRAEGLFIQLVGLHDGDMAKSQLSTMGRLLARYNNRRVGTFRFVIAGVGHARRFHVTKEDSADLHGRMVKHGVSSELLKNDIFDSKGEHHADHVDHATPRRRLPSPGKAAPPLKFTPEGRAAHINAANTKPKRR